MGFLALPDAHFWADPLRERRAVTRDLLTTGALGLLLDGPGEVDVDGRGTLPLVAAHVATHADFDQAGLGRHGVLSAIEVESGQVVAERLQELELAPAGRAGASTPSKKATGALLWTTDARRRLSLPWAAGRWLFTVHVGGASSNRHEALLHRPAAYDDPAAVEELLVAERRRRLSAWPDAAQRRDGDVAAPPVPAEPGLVLELDRVAILRHGAPVEARLSFRLPARPGDRALEGVEVPGAPGATAVVPVALLLAGTRALGPQLVRLRLPSFDPPGADEVTGQATLDLRALPGVALSAQGYHAWALSGEQLAGGVPFTLLTEEQVLDR